MRRFVIFFNFKTETLTEMVEQATARGALFTKAAEGAGGKLEGYYLTFGHYDGLAIVEADNQRLGAAIGLALRSTGQFDHVETHTLISTEDFKEVLEAAKRARPS